MVMSQSQFGWTISSALPRLPVVPSRTCGCQAGKIDKFLESGSMFEAGLDEIFRAQGIHLEIGLGVDGPGHAGEMKHQVHIFNPRPQRILVLTISVDQLDGKALHPR